MTSDGGSAWVFGDNIDTDQLAPGSTLKSGIEVVAAACLSRLNPDFAKQVLPGDFVIGGSNFGIGSSREQAAQALRHLGVAAVIAPSFGGIFYRNAFNFGLLALVCADASSIAQNDRLSIDAEKGILQNLTRDEKYKFEAVPAHLLDIISAGGLVPYLEANRR
ncbi:MAG: 3-isopropylmalate dehydratase [Proteobacteria bacterium]|nr:3-isopropylmalate dehydratase [Pseudomonadota bacterium]